MYADIMTRYIEAGPKHTPLGHFRYIKIQPKTKELKTRLWGITNHGVCGAYSPEPRFEVYCFKLKFGLLVQLQREFYR